MNLKEASEKINSEGFEGIAEIKADYVFLQPKGVDVSNIWGIELTRVHQPALQGAIEAAHLEWEYVANTKNRLLGKISRSMNLSPNFKLYSKNNLIQYTRFIQPKVHKGGVFSMSYNENFENEFYKGYKKNKFNVLTVNSNVIKVVTDLVYKYYKLKSPFTNNEFSVFFQPSKYIESENELWKLISILGEEHFTSQIKINHFIINELFIINSFRSSRQYFYISKKNNKIFASINERISSRNPDLSKIKLSSLLKYLNVTKIESLIEKGEIKF